MTLAACVAAQGAAADETKPRQCAYKVERASMRSDTAKFESGKDAPMLLSAVEKRVDGCPVLTEAGTGRMIEPPVFDGRDAKLAPAR
ncbi:hypothetical protein [Novosphingobium resinovorum]|uniref:hypothetical protein n=1 Tax=Novosphingobium resinovorum TaxID=158500 RepID=UPI002ED4475A|nr:hypothetical protein [Novosphingobium resinovorum]